jgi:hypothetical protein
LDDAVNMHAHEIDHVLSMFLEVIYLWITGVRGLRRRPEAAVLLQCGMIGMRQLVLRRRNRRNLSVRLSDR